jgi:hypothetical protein
VPACLKEDKPKAGTIPGGFALGAAPAETSGHGPQTGVKAQKPIQAHVIRRAMSALMFLFCLSGAANQPDENQSGRDGWTNRQVGPARSEMIRHP